MLHISLIFKQFMRLNVSFLRFIKLIKFNCHINSEELIVMISKWDYFKHKLNFHSQINAFLKMAKDYVEISESLFQSASTMVFLFFSFFFFGLTNP